MAGQSLQSQLPEYIRIPNGENRNLVDCRKSAKT